MIIIIFGIIGALLGGLNARKQRGNRKDIAQYAVGYAMAFMVFGMILTVILDRTFGLS